MKRGKGRTDLQKLVVTAALGSFFSYFCVNKRKNSYQTL